MGDLRGVLQELYARTPRGRQLGLERMEAACARFGNPERAFRVVHVAGTNGKGSVCALTESTLRAAGHKTGLYTSPHLMRFAERVQIDGVPLDDERLTRLLGEVLDREPELTFFEATTLLAFLAFREAKVDLAVLEVGLGGRLDATNVVPPPVAAAITRIAFDHTTELGDSLRAIAAEKAAIIKPGTAVVLGKLHPDALEVITQRIAEVGASLLPLAPAEPSPGARVAYPRLALLGSNLAVANTLALHLGVTRDQLAEGIERTAWPGRNELLHRGGHDLTLLDCAHNPDGALALSHLLDPGAIGGSVTSRRDVALVFGAVQGKRWKAMLARLRPAAAHRVFCTPPIGKGVPAAEMAAAVGGEVASSVGDALTRARTLVGSRGLVVVTGSCFLVGAARALLLGGQTDPAVDL